MNTFGDEVGGFHFADKSPLYLVACGQLVYRGCHHHSFGANTTQHMIDEGGHRLRGYCMSGWYYPLTDPIPELNPEITVVCRCLTCGCTLIECCDDDYLLPSKFFLQVSVGKSHLIHIWPEVHRDRAPECGLGVL